MSNFKVIGRYMWLLNALRSAGHMTRSQLESAWLHSQISEGKPLRRRTFYADRLAVKELFGVNIVYNTRTLEYSIEGDDRPTENSLMNWLAQSQSVNKMLSSALELSDRIVLEDVPSARENLAPILEAMIHCRSLCFTYRPFSRTLPTHDLIVEPYMVKLFRRRWYLTGRNSREHKLKTYALDRIEQLEVMPDEFDLDTSFNAESYFGGSFGIVVDSSDVRRVVIKADTVQARYLRALPLHPSQQEMFGTGYSLFTYHLRITDDLVAELLSRGPAITVLNPKELRDKICNVLHQTLALYEPNTSIQ